MEFLGRGSFSNFQCEKYKDGTKRDGVDQTTVETLGIRVKGQNSYSAVLSAMIFANRPKALLKKRETSVHFFIKFLRAS